ncbi:alpha/beta hydrolase [Alphaproteobacteria bacterium]|nr:alpha/beta hydrolase [Alphaproteobacteria bacterium]MDC1241062.1 alpha/beta hydrolase [bacterium]
MPQALVNDIHLYYERRVPVKACGAPPLIFIRGLGTQLIQWPESFLQYFLDLGLELILFDNRDAGLSQKLDAAGVPDIGALLAGADAGAFFPVPYTIADMAQDVIALMDALEIDKANIFGMSLGGAVAQHLAFSHASRMAHVVCVMASSGNPDLPAPDLDNLAPSGADDQATLVQDVAEGSARYMSPAFPTPPEQRLALAEKIIARSYHPQGVIRQMAAIVVDGSRVERLKTIDLPFLVVHGDCDILLEPVCGEDIAHHVPGAQWLLVEGMGHDIGPGVEKVIGPVMASFLQLA